MIMIILLNLLPQGQCVNQVPWCHIASPMTNELQITITSWKKVSPVQSKVWMFESGKFPKKPSPQQYREPIPYQFNSLVPGRLGCHFKTAIFNLVLLIGFFRSSDDYAPRWMPWDLTDDESTLGQVMVWCRQATSHYLSQCWPSSMSPYGVTRPQWVNSVAPRRCSCNLKSGIFKLISRIDIKHFL